ncbi:MAG: leucine-rich repeat protein [Clostridiales bacterium]|nr:leucine-rich repeat protein [Clostridiales bacterium]
MKALLGSRRLFLILITILFLLATLVACTPSAAITITFNSMGGSQVAPRSVDPNQTELDLPEPEKDGYIFDGWYYNSDYATKVDPKVIPAESVTFYAKWSVKTVLITFLDQDDNVIDSKTVDYNSTISYNELPPPPLIEGYKSEWYTLDNVKVTENILKNVTSDLSLKVVYTQNFGSVSYYVSDKDKDESYTYLSNPEAQLSGYNLYSYSIGLPGEAIDLLSNHPYKEGHSFLGWFYDKALTDKCLTLPDRIPSYDLVLYAGFIDVSEMYKYLTYENVTIDSQSGLSITGLTALGQSQSTIAIPSYIGGKKVLSIGREYVDGSSQLYRVFTSAYLTNIIIPETVISIGAFAFAQNSRLETVTVLANHSTQTHNLISIGTGAFAGCSSLKEVNIPDSVATIGAYAFAGIARTKSDSKVSLNSNAEWAKLDTWYLTDMALEKVNISSGSALTNLRSYAFYNTPMLKSISLPKSFTHVDYAMFDGSSLQKINLFEGNTDLVNVGDAIYSKDKTILFYYPMYASASFTLHENTGVIESNAFYNNKTLTDITFNDKLQTIGASAFENAISLDTIILDTDIPLDNIGAYAFANCQNLKEIVFPHLINTLGQNILYNCSLLTRVSFAGNSLNSIPAYAFYGCENLEEVEIKPNVKSIGDYAFYGCESLTGLDIDTEKSIMDAIGAYSFANCISLEQITLPYELKTIGQYAFAGIDKTMRVRMSLFNTKLETIGDYALKNNSGLDTVSLPQTLLSLGSGAFENCTSLTILQLNSAPSLAAIPDRAFYNCNSINNVVIMPEGLQAIGNYAFYSCSSINYFTLNNVQVIGDSAFENCTGLQEGSNVNQYILPSKLHTLGQRAFANCQNLTSIHIPKDLTAISKEAFLNCAKLTDIVYDANYTLDTIGENSFANCTSLTTFDIPSTLKPRDENQGFIKNPFFGCTALLNFTNYSPNVNNLVVSNGIIFEKTVSFEGTQLYAIYAYPTGRGDEYEVATDVTEINDYAFYGSRITSIFFTQATPEPTRELITLVKIGSYAFASCNMLTSAQLSKRVYEIGNYAFYNAKDLQELDIDPSYAYEDGTTDTPGVYYKVTNLGQNPSNNNLVTLGDYAFAKTAIVTLQVPSRVININKGAFSDCYTLLSVNFDDSYDTNLLSIGDYAFYADNGLTSLTLPVQLKSIGKYAFAYCVNIRDIQFKTSVNANGGDEVELDIGDYAFSNCHFLYTLSLPSSLKSMGEGIFSYASRLKYVNFAPELNLSRTSLAIPKYAFLGDAAIEKISIPYYITNIGDSAFFELALDEVEFLTSPFEQSLSIGDYAFANLQNLHSITLPDRLSEIGNHAFENTRLSNLTYNNSGLDLAVGDYAFRNIDIAAIDINSRIVSLGVGCFSDNRLLTTVNYIGHTDLIIANETYLNSSLREINFDSVPDNVNIGDRAFENTPYLSIVSLSDNGTTMEAENNITIGRRAFYLSGIDNVSIIGQSVYIKDEAFLSAKLTYFNISAHTIFGIGQLALANNLRLSSLQITASDKIEHLGHGFASYNTALQSIELIDPSNKYNACDGVVYSGTALMLYPAGKVGSTYTALNDNYVLTLSDPGDMHDNFGIYFTFDGQSYTKLTSPATWQINTYYTKAVKTIAPYAFAGNTHLRNLILDSGNAVLQKDTTSFVANDASLTFFVPSELVNSYINDWAVNNIAYITKNLDGMVLKLLVSNRYAVEKYTGSQTDIVINSTMVDNDKVYNVVSIADYAFNQNISIKKVSLGPGIEKIGKYAFANCISLTTFTSGSLLTLIKQGGFKNCVNLTSVTLNDGLKTIETFAFDNCVALTDIILPDTIKTIGKYAFANCLSLANVELGQGVEVIMDNAFENCISLVSISIPNSVKEIASSVFANCSTLSYVYVHSTSVPSLKKNGFGFTIEGMRILVANHLLFSFQSATNWRDYANKMLPIEYICKEPGFEDYIIEKISGSNYRLVGYLGNADTIYIESNISQDIIITEISSYAINHFAKEITLAEGIASLNSYAFYNARNLETIMLPSTLESIGEYAFYGLSALNSVTVSDFVEEQIVIPKLKTISSYAFYNTCLQSFVVPENVTRIGDFAFSADDTSYLKEITFSMKDLEQNRLDIGKFAFKNNIYLKSIVFDCFVDSIDQGAFDNCISLQDIKFNSVRTDSQGKATKTLSSQSIFANCNNLTVFVRQTTILNNFKSVWLNDNDKNKLYLADNIVRDNTNNVFYVYDSGDKVAVDAYNYFVLEIAQGSSSVAYIKNYIGEYTGRYVDEHQDDKKDTDIVIPNSVVIGDRTYTITQIASFAFNDKITSVTIPDSVEEISSYAFYNATSLEAVNLSINSKLKTIGASAFENCLSLTSFTVPNTVVNIHQGAFRNCANLTDINFTQATNEHTSLVIGDYAFENCAKLSAINIPKHASQLGIGIFKNAKNLASVNFDVNASKLNSIGAWAFQNTALSTITFPRSLHGVGDYAFDSCLELNSVYLTRTDIPLTSTQANVFNNIPNPFIRVYVPYSSYNNYDTLPGWRTRSVLADQKDDSGKFNYMLTGAMGSQTAIITNYLGSETTLYVDAMIEIGGVPYRVSAISSYAGNIKITKVEFPETSYLATLSEYAFANCTSLREIHLPDSVTSIGAYAFASCTSLTDITLPKGIDSISERTFSGCESLKEITLPSNVLFVGQAAFVMCYNLNRVIVEMTGPSVAPIGSGAFTNVSQNLIIVVPTELKTAFKNEWYQYSDHIYARNEMYGDYIIQESVDAVTIVQYNGYTDGLNFDEITIKGKKITAVLENAYVDKNLTYMIDGEWRKNGTIL